MNEDIFFANRLKEEINSSIKSIYRWLNICGISENDVLDISKKETKYIQEEMQILNRHILMYESYNNLYKIPLEDAEKKIKVITNLNDEANTGGVGYYLRPISKKHKVEFVVEGFMRQGNNNLRKIILNSFPDVAIPMNLTHYPQSVLQAAKNNKNTLCTIRHPVETVASFIKKEIKVFDDQSIFENQALIAHKIDILLEMYCYFYEMILENSKKILVIDFETMIKNTDLILNTISLKYNLSIKKKFKKDNNNHLRNLPDHQSTKDDKIIDIVSKIESKNKFLAIKKYQYLKSTADNQILRYMQNML